MIPQIFTIGPFPFVNLAIPINSFGLMVALAIIAGSIRLARSFEIQGLDPALAERYSIVGGISGIVGARIWYVATNAAEIQGDIFGALTSRGGFVFFGGFIIAIATLCVFLKRDGVPFHKFFDSAGPTMCLGYAIGRLGCQLSGDGDYGVQTTGWFGMSYLLGVMPTPPGVRAIPTPLVESMAMLVILWAVTHIERLPRWQAPWRRVGFYLVLIGIERFIIEFWRPNPKLIAGVGGGIGYSEAQVIAVVMFCIGVVLLVRSFFINNQATSPSLE